MNIEKCIMQVSTFLDLKRIANPYVIDYRKLSFDELKDAMLKTAPQYYNEENVRKVLNNILISSEQRIRVIAPIILKELLLNKDDFMDSQKSIDEDVLLYEQTMVNKANEINDNKFDEKLNLFKAVLEAAWEKDDDINSDEQNLINRIKAKLKISDGECILVEAVLGKYPTVGNSLHLKEDVEYVRRHLQSNGLLFCVRDTDNVNYDVIPTEIVDILRKLYSIDMKRHSYTLLMQSKYVKNKAYLVEMLGKAGVKANTYQTLAELHDLCIKHLPAHNLILGFTPLDGLDKTTLSSWCEDLLNKKVYVSKNEMAEIIIDYYDDIKQIVISSEDDREKYYNYYEALACRDLALLRKQGIIDKDIDTERKFEQATNYLFEVILKNKPLIMNGTEHPDGMLSYNDRLIMWDNKSKESPVNLADHIKQFERYVNQSEKNVAVFMVIAPSFTNESIVEASKFSLTKDTMMLLITASELKSLAEEWKKKHPNDIFPLGYFKQTGRFNPQLVII